MKKVGNRKKRWFIGILLVIFAFTWMPELVSMENNITEVEAAKPKINAKKVYLIKGLSKQLKVSGYQGKIKWSSSNKKVATVTGKGLVKAKNKGAATISASFSGKKLKCQVVVETPGISEKSAQIGVGKSKILKVNGTRQKITWSSSNKSVAEVSSRGKVTARKIGKAKITAQIGKKKYVCQVQVVKKVAKPVPVSEVTLNVNSLSMDTGEIFYLKANVLPSNATNKTVTWKSSNSGIVSVDKNGTLIARSAGDVTVTAVCGSKSASCDIWVRKNKASAEEPNYIISQSGEVDWECGSVVIEIENCGSSIMEISGKYAMLLDSSNKGFDRDLLLIDIDALLQGQLRTLDYVEILPGQSMIVAFMVKGSDTWYDDRTIISFDFEYDSRMYTSESTHHETYYYDVTNDYNQ